MSKLDDHINKTLLRINELRFGSAASKWEEAMLLYQLRSIPWKTTEYGSWKTFCSKQIDQHMSGINAKIVAFRIANEKLKYNMEELFMLSELFSFTTLSGYFATINRKIAVSTLKRKFTNKTMREASGKLPTVKANMDNHFSFVLSEDHAPVLEGLLSQYGMHKTPAGRKQGISDAMEAFLDSYEWD